MLTSLCLIRSARYSASRCTRETQIPFGNGNKKYRRAWNGVVYLKRKTRPVLTLSIFEVLTVPLLMTPLPMVWAAL